MTIGTPTIAQADWADAYAMARDRGEPVFVPVSPYCDDRGWSLMNLFGGAVEATGQVNFSVQYPGVVKAWHRHDRQTDFWICVEGHIKAGVYREEDDARWQMVMGERRPGVLIIPPPLWHGAATVGTTPARLLYYVTQRYNSDRPDEFRRPWDSVEGFSWGVQSR